MEGFDTARKRTLQNNYERLGPEKIIHLAETIKPKPSTTPYIINPIINFDEHEIEPTPQKEDTYPDDDLGDDLI